ncbi:Myotrophin [Clonorchis sinensis]|uniref:Myotrophin n=1 Tax=Clonorchis sinensis TaxID=79923 RepID=A0A8T1M705_CLOSI|nr:Myotrophin [Clonorchis sinensis]
MTTEGLLWALKNGDLQGFKDLSQNLPDVCRFSTNGRSLLHYAADYGQPEICEYLLSKGADVNTPDDYGVTPLLAAIYENHIDCARVLLEKGAKFLNTPDGVSYLEAAESEKLRTLLLEFGAS